jgi:hypothetical protein
MTNQQKIEMYSRIKKHGDTLKNIFNLNIDSVKLCKKLFRLERKAQELQLDYYEGMEIDKEVNQLLIKVAEILNTNINNIFFNGDPRGYALKFKEEFVKDKNIIHRDWGGYGIVAPDLSEGV